MTQKLSELSPEQLSEIEYSFAFAEFVERFKPTFENLEIPPMGLIRLLLYVFVLVFVVGCSDGDELHADGIDGENIFLLDDCENQDGVMKRTMEIPLNDPEAILSGFKVELLEDDNNGVDDVTDRSFDFDEGQQIRLGPGNNEITQPIGTDGVISVSTEFVGGSATNDLLFTWYEGGRERSYLLENFGCVETLDGFHLVSHEILDCSSANGDIFLTVEHTLDGVDADGILRDFSFGGNDINVDATIQIDGQYTLSGNTEIVSKGEEVDLIPNANGNIVMTYTITPDVGQDPLDIDIVNTYDVEEQDGSVDAGEYTISNAGCELVCPNWNPTYHSLEIKHDGCRLEFTIELEGCSTFTGSIEMGLQINGVDLQNINATLFDEENDYRNIALPISGDLTNTPPEFSDPIKRVEIEANALPSGPFQAGSSQNFTATFVNPVTGALETITGGL